MIVTSHECLYLVGTIFGTIGGTIVGTSFFFLELLFEYCLSLGFLEIQ
jgi:hypothetical protein